MRRACSTMSATAFDFPSVDFLAKLEMPALKSLIVEGDKCKVQIEDIRHLRRHMMNGQKWLARFEKARAEDLEEMLALRLQCLLYLLLSLIVSCL